ncbi:LysR substrate-binding domain-containing protein [Neorhizobium sp. P12A]|uniref:LysR substrate-binding domain-containing protein n=1 Tax=Neorhizobium sp. P12A TaxID=2268027 RepID=UPI0032B2A4C2
MTDIHDAMLGAQSLQEIPSGTLRINAFASAAREVMEPLILSFLQRYPQVRVDLATKGKLGEVGGMGPGNWVRSNWFQPSVTFLRLFVTAHQCRPRALELSENRRR